MSAPNGSPAAFLLERGAADPGIRLLTERLRDVAAGAPAAQRKGSSDDGTRTPVRIRGVAGSAGALAVALLARGGRSMAIVAPDLDRAEAWRDDLGFLLGPERVVFLPPHDTVPWSTQIATAPVRDERLDALLRLGDPAPPVAVIPAASLHRLIPTQQSIRGRAIPLAPGAEMAPESLVRRLVHTGYRPVPEVVESGELSRRGGILDVLGPGLGQPIRIEFDADTVASIRTFDLVTQRSVAPVAHVRIGPAREHIYAESIEDRLRPLDRASLEGPEGRRVRAMVAEAAYFEGMEWLAPHLGIPLGSVLDHLEPGVALWVDEPDAVARELEDLEAESVRLESDARERTPHLPPREALFDSPARCLARLSRRPRVEASIAGRAIDGDAVSLDVRPQPSFGRKLDLLRVELRRLSGLDYARVILCDNRGQAERLEEILGDAIASIEVGSLVHGFVLPGARLAVFTDHEIFARYRRRGARRLRTPVAALRDVLTLDPGDYVVHLDHGVGVYRGLKRLMLDGQDTECLQVDYYGTDRLFVPIDQVGMIQRYAAEEGRVPAISRLGGTAWQRTKAKARRAIQDMAEELLRRNAVRKSTPGHAFPDDTPWQRELESAFIYEETPDQMRAVQDVKRDMGSTRPMDRLLCGDVGYGKTEIAIRAAFKAVQDGKQVAVLVPTTVLAQQHFVTFTERLADFPVRTDMLSRFRTPQEQRDIVERIGRGAIDVVIGTHRILSKDVRFPDLGLVVIDEEQRFGVRQKERIRSLVETVDVLTLSATPIPRTLHMSLLGARDMSIMTTPPRGRYPIKTEIVELSKEVVQDALLREADRGGQSFFVHNRVESIDSMAHYLRSVAPQLRFGVAHGQMRDAELERVMLDFLERRTDVLVTTLIIESGLDIPTVNTMLVNRADTFGLAQLYQLRGRIGRSHHQAFCYLLVPQAKVPTEEAEKRLRILVEYQELGAGLAIAMRDLEIRGAGNLLGAEQHGFMVSVGFDLYCRMVDEVVHELKGEQVKRRPEPELASDLPAFVPETYISDRDEKLDVYRRVAGVANLAGIEAIRGELRDRFGPLPAEVEHLLALRGLRLLGREAGASRMRVERARVEVELAEPLARDTALRLVASIPGRVEFVGTGARTIRLAKPPETLAAATNLLRRLHPSDSVPGLPVSAAGT